MCIRDSYYIYGFDDADDNSTGQNGRQLQPDETEISCQRQATTELVDMIRHVRTQVHVARDSDSDIGQIDTNERSTSGHEQTGDTSVAVKLSHDATSLVTLPSHTAD